MSNLLILSENERENFDNPPVLPAEIKTLCFTITPELEEKIKQLRTKTNKVGFLLQYGYFKACKRFFTINQFSKEDIKYVAKLLGITLSEINMTQYQKTVPAKHQLVILESLGYKPFNETVIPWLQKEVKRKVNQTLEPRQIFIELLQKLHQQKIEVPSSHRLFELITTAYLDHEAKLLAIISKNISLEQKGKLESLLVTSKKDGSSLLNQFKIINQSVKPKAIQASVNLFMVIKDYFETLLPLIEALKLSPNNCSYYAIWLKKAKLSQLRQFPDPNKKFLYLIAFIQHQFYSRQDAFVDILIKSVQSTKNTIVHQLNDLEQSTRSQRKSAVQHLIKSNKSHRLLIDEISGIVKSPLLTDSGKVQKITQLLEQHENEKNDILKKKEALFEMTLDNISKDKDYFEILEKLSIKLQNRVSEIIQVLSFNHEASNKGLIKAIQFFRDKKGQANQKSPTDFLKKNEIAVLFNEKNQFRSSLYKALLFIYITDAIKSGELNLKYSYRYLPIQDYLIDKKTWTKQFGELLKSADLKSFANFKEVMGDLKQKLEEKYQYVNQRFLEGRNPYLSIKPDDDVQVTTPPLDEKETKYIAGLLEQAGYIPIFRVLSEIDKMTGFTKSLKHHSIKHVKTRPDSAVFIAGIIGLGSNIGIPKMAQISTGVNEYTLLNTVNWYFSRKNLLEANERIITLINKLSLSNIFLEDSPSIHGSSDGRKVTVGVESLLANYSFKYFGQDKGISVYTFIDERQSLFHALVMSSTEREAPYVLDGLLENNVTKVNIHSTDTHGYSETIFAATHFMGVSFAPRIKQIGKQHIYAFSSIKTYKKRGFKILPSRTINWKLIEKHWNDILRFMVTIKLKEVTASQLFKRLSSYAKDNPLYKALKEFGRIIKSLFILSYYDDVKLRQRIEKQLNRIESSNKFSNAVFYANDQEFKQATREEQEVVVFCKILIQNSIILWNYLYISQLLVNCLDDNERIDMVSLIKEGSIITWRHINLHGEFNFEKPVANDSFFDIGKILSLQLNRKAS